METTIGTAIRIAADVRAGRRTVREVLDACLARIEAEAPGIGEFVTPDGDLRTLPCQLADSDGPQPLRPVIYTVWAQERARMDRRESENIFCPRAISPVFISMGLEIEKSFVNCRFSRVVHSVSAKESH